MGEGRGPAPVVADVASASAAREGGGRGTAPRRVCARRRLALLLAVGATLLLSLTVPVALDASDTSGALEASRRLRETMAGGPAVALDTPSPLLQRDEGDLVVMEHDGSDYSKDDPDGVPNYVPRAQLAQRFYERHGDNYDFLVVFTNFEFDTGAALAFYNLVRNDVTGIGAPLVNNGPFFGSPGRLKGYIDMAALSRYQTAPYSTVPGEPGFFGSLGILAHETGHQWLAFPRYRNAAGELSPDLLGRDGSHWSYLLDSDASHLYGSEWVPRDDGTWEAVRIRDTFSALDLYLMGFLPPEQVGPITLLRNPAIDTTQLPREGAVVTAQAETLDIQQVQSAEGLRLPDHLASPKEFRFAFVFLVAPGTYPNADQLAAVDRLRDAFSGYFFAQTRGVAVADTTLAEEPPVAAVPAPDLERARAWLLGRQASDGRWEDTARTAARDTAAAVSALFRAGDLGPGYQLGVDWLRRLVPGNLDFAARRATPLAAAGMPPPERKALAEDFVAAASADGGFGPAPGYASDALDTALALRALRTLDHGVDSTVQAAFDALAAQVHPSGGWALVPGREPSTVVTAEVLLALVDWKEVPAAQQLVPSALAALESRRNLDGGFGESPSTPYATALGLRALMAAGAPDEAVNPALAWLEATQRVDGSWGGRSYDTALVVDALRSGLTPNLVVPADSVVLDPTVAIEGETVRVSFLVRNSGRAPAAGSTARVFDGPPSLGQVLGEVAVPPLAVGEERPFDVVFDTDNRAGERSIYVVADAAGEVAEGREDDNAAQRGLTVAGILPDLVVRPAGLNVVPYPPAAGETASVRVRVTNEGEDDSPETVLRLFLGSPRGGGILIGEASLPALDPGAATVVTLGWDTSGAVGEQVLHAVVDALYAVPESDETNNEAAIVVQVEEAPTPEADLELAALSLAPEDLTTLPQTVTATALVRNLGLEGVTSTVALYDTDPPAGEPVAESPVTLGPRDSTTLEIPVVVTAAGDRTFVAVADPTDQVLEPREDNNEARAVLTDLGSTFDVEVDPTGTSATPTDLVVGETVTVNVLVRNRGTAFLAAVPLVLELVGTDAVAEVAYATASIAPGDETVVALSWATGTVGDPLTLRVRADPFDLLDELDESNNDAVLTVTVRDSPLPNLAVRGDEITLDPEPPLQGSAATVSVVVRNTGVVPAPAFGLEVFRGDPEDGGILIGEERVTGLDAGTSTTVAVAWSVVDTRGTLGIFARVDPGGEVEEYDETDNLAFRPLAVLGLPDLVAAAADVTLTPPFPRAGDPVDVRLTVRNLGDRASPEAPWRALEGEPGAVVAQGSVPPIPPGETGLVGFAWTPADPPGERRLTIVIDPDGEVPEADEGNNAARRTVVAQDADLFLSAPYFSPDGDGVQDTTVLAYRAVGAEAVDVVVSNARGREVARLGEGAPPAGSIEWDGRTPEGRLLPDGAYTLSLVGADDVILGRAVATIDLNLVPIHEVAGTPNAATQVMTCSFPSFEGPAFPPAEDEALYILPDTGLEELPPGLVRVGLDGGYTYLVEDPWYDGGTFFPGRAPVSPDGREVLVGRSSGRELWSVDLLSGERRFLAGLQYDELYDPGVSWSPDGAFIYVGRRLLPREGGEPVTLPLPGGWAWSPDGQFLARYNFIVRRDLSETRLIPLPDLPDGANDYYGLVLTEWLPDGRIFSYIGEEEIGVDRAPNEADPVPDAPPAASADANWESACGPDVEGYLFGCAVMIDPESEEAIGLRWLARRISAHYGDGPYIDWSPAGDRVLYTTYYFWLNEVIRVLDHSEVAFESGLGVRRYGVTEPVFASPRSSLGHYVAWNTYQSASFPAGCEGDTQSMLVRNLENLTAELRVSRLPGNGGLLLRGIAADRHLDHWQLDYARPAEPDVWRPIGPAFDVPVLDEVLGSWVPPGPGEYAIRLTAWDLAGNVKSRTRVVSWSRFPVISNFSQDEFLISPNDDGVRDEVTFSYVVQEPTRLDVRIRGPLHDDPDVPGTTVVRQLAFEYPEIGGQSFVWDGRDGSGQVVPDGRYEALLNGVPMYVEVDVTPPDIAWAWDDVRLERVDLLQGPIGVLKADRLWHVVDAHLASWEALPEAGALPFETGTLPVYEPRKKEGPPDYYNQNYDDTLYGPDGLPLIELVDGRPVDVRDEVGQVESVAVHPGAVFRASDYAGNVSQVPIVPVPEDVFVRHARETGAPPDAPPLFVPPIIDTEIYRFPLSATFALSETIRETPEEGELVHFEAQPLSGGAWLESPPVSVNAKGQLSADFLDLGFEPGGRYRGRFACDDDGVERRSGEFSFQLCRDFRKVRPYDPFNDPPSPAFDYVVATGTAVPAVSATISLLTREERPDGSVIARPARLSGGREAEGLPTEALPDGRFLFVLPPDLEEGFCRVEAVVRDAAYQFHGPDNRPPCQVLTLDSCVLGGGPPGEGSWGVWTEEEDCASALPDVRRVRVLNGAVGWDTVSVVGDPGGLDRVLAEVELGPGQARTVLADVSAFPEGRLRIDLRDGDGQGRASLTTRVDRTDPVVEIPQPVEGESPCLEIDPATGREVLPVVVRALDAAPSLDAWAEYRRTEGPWTPLRRACGQPVCVGLETLYPGRPARTTWDVSSLPDGEYTIRVTACDGHGNTGSAERRVFLQRDPPTIEVVGVDRRDFSPNGDGRADTVTATFETLQALRLTAVVRQESAEGGVVRTLFRERTLAAGPLPVTWDGRSPEGEALPDGPYWIELQGENACGQSGSAGTPVELDTRPPDIGIASPVEDATVFGTAEIVGYARDRKIATWTLGWGPAGDTLATRTFSVGDPGNPQPLALWDTPADTGPYELTLSAEDAAENQAFLAVPVTVGPRSRIDRLGVDPALFSPNGDGRRETAEITYALLYEAGVTLEVVSGATVWRTLVADVVQPAGDHGMAWDGRNDAGEPAPDGPYRVVLTARDPAGVGSEERVDVGVEIDRTPPAVAVTQPEADAYLGRADAVLGSVSDRNLSGWTVGTVDLGPAALAEGGDAREEAPLAALSVLDDGPHVLVLAAEDAAENRSRLEVPFTLDSLPPVALIAAPAPGSVWPKTAPVPVTGNATDDNLLSWRLRFGAGAEPAAFVELARGDQGGVDLALASWDVSSLPDGDYTLWLQVVDKAGHESEARRVVAIDGTPPTAIIEQPLEAGYVTAPRPVTGTARDLHLESWTLEIAVGPAAAAFAWTPLADGTEEVDDTLLATLDPLPPDGVHTLRLTVRDRAGLVSEALRTFTVDTTPPAPPQPRGRVVPDGQGTADVVVEWDPNTEPDLAGYHVTVEGDTLIGLLTAPTHTDPGREDGSYRYDVTAEDLAGNVSEPGTVTVRVDLTPPRVDILRPEAGDSVSGTVDIRGTAWSADDFAEYRVYVGVGAAPSSWSLVRRSTLPVLGGVLGTWTALGDGPHVIALEAEDTTGNSARTEQPVVVDNRPPAAPVLTSVEVEGAPDALLSTWLPSPDPDVTGYLVYRNERLANAPGLVLGDLKPYEVPPPSHLDPGLPDGRHCYHVVAADEAGNHSPPSNEICRDLDNRTPRAVIVDPPDGTRFEFPLRVIADTPDTDVTTVQFQITPEGQAQWENLGPADAQPPWETTLDPEPLTFGEYELRAVATDAGPPPKTDPAPPAISVLYGDVTPPEIPVDLQARVDGRAIHVSWTANTEVDVAGYRLFRYSEQLGGDPLTATAYDDDRAPGTYSYTVQAVDVDGNESGLSDPAEAVVYAVELNQPYPVTVEPEAALSGSRARPDTTVGILRDGAAIASAPAPGYFFEVPGVPVQLGANLLSARGEDDEGNRSIPSEEIILIGNDVPGAVTGFQGTNGPEAVGLTWDVSPEPDVVGYRVRRGDEALLEQSLYRTAASISASSVYGSAVASRAFDGNRSTIWRPDYGDSTPFWEVVFPEPVLIEKITLHFAYPSGTPFPVPRYRVEVLWEGLYLPLFVVSGNTQATVEHTLPSPFSTDTLRVTLVDRGSSYVGIAEVEVLRTELVPKDAPGWSDGDPLKDGDHEYSVAAVDRYGANSPWTAITVAVDRLSKPTGLVGVDEGADAVLTWDPNPEPDIDFYKVFRGGELIGTAPTPSYRDPGLPNAEYVYTVAAVDADGNESEESDPATVVIQVLAPQAPVLQAVATPRGHVALSWAHPGAPAYALYRSTASGGPYTLLTRTPQTSYLDTTAALGLEHFYIVVAEDELTGPSPASNEASATPEITDPLDAPVIVFPTDAAHPITLESDFTVVRGRAEPETWVQLDVNGWAEGAGGAVPRFTWQGLMSMDPDVRRALLSPDGRRLALARPGGAGRTTLQVRDLATFAEREISTAPYLDCWPLAFSPEGERLLLHAWGTEASAEVDDLVMVDVVSGALTVVAGGPTVSPEATWAPDGNRVAFVVLDDLTADCGLQVKDLVSGQVRSLEVGGCAVSPRWSPVDDTIAYLQIAAEPPELRVAAVDGSFPPRLLDAGPDQEARWSADGRELIYTVRDGALRVRVADVETGALTDLTDGATDAFDGRFGPEGRWISYVQLTPEGEQVTALERATGVLTPVNPMPLQRRLIHEWTRQGYLAVADQDIFGLYPGFDGSFEAFVPLEGGDNYVVARSIDPESDLTSPDSEAVKITVPASVAPDLTLLEGDLLSSPLVPFVSQPARLFAHVRNVGAWAANDFGVAVTLVDPLGAEVLRAERVVETLQPGEVETLVLDFVPTVPGRYGLVGEVDIHDVVTEAREDNNVAARVLDVAWGPGLVAVVQSDRAAYPAHTPALVAPRVVNAGPTFQGTARTTVEDPTGQVVADLGSRPLVLAYGQVAEWGQAWNTGATFAGDYVFRLRVVDALGGEAAVAARPFRILPDVAVPAHLRPDAAAVPAGTPATFQGGVENRGANVVWESLVARFTVVAAGAPGPPLYEASLPIPRLLPAGAWEAPLAWPAATPEGAYVAVLDVIDGAEVLSTATAPFEVTPAEAHLVGTIQGLPEHVIEGDPFEAAVEVSNLGQAGVTDHPGVVEVVSGPEATVHLTEALSFTVAPEGIWSTDVPLVSLGLAPGPYSLRLRAGDPATTLARGSLWIHGLLTPPSPDAPADDGRVDTPHPVLSVNNASSSEGAPLTYEFEVYRDAALTNLVPRVSGIPETPDRTAWRVTTELNEDARYWWRARATDGHSTSAWTEVWSFVVDAVNLPPEAPTPVSPLDGGRVASTQPPLVALNAIDLDLDPLTYEFRLALDPELQTVVASTTGLAEGEGTTTWALPLALEEDETYCWAVRASDGVHLSPWSWASCFLVDTGDEPPTAPVPIRPIGRATITTITPDLVVGPAQDPEGAALTYLFQLDTTPAFDSADLQASPEMPEGGPETIWTPEVPLRDNTLYDWRAAARDETTWGPWAAATFFVNFGNDPPSVPILLDPVGGAAVATFTPTLRLRNATDPDLETLGYDFLVVDDTGATVAEVEGVPEGPAETEWTLPVTLDEGRVYEWRARARDAEGAGEWSAWEGFRVRVAPTAPGLVAPAEGATVDVRRPALVVSNATSPRDFVLTYSFELSAVAADGTTTLVDSVEGVAEGVANTQWIPGVDLDDGGYSWRARAFDGSLYGPWMSTARFTVAVDVPPEPPTGLTAVPGDALVELEWNASPEPDVVGYRVYRSLVEGGPYELLAEADLPAHVDLGLTNGTTYYYVVTALDARFESAYSAEAAATPQASPTTIVAEVRFKPRKVSAECLLSPGCRGDSHSCPRAHEAGHDLVESLLGLDEASLDLIDLPMSVDRQSGPSCGGPPEPEVDCPEWIKTFIELPPGYRPEDIDVTSVRVAGSVAADPKGHRIVDSDGDGVMELRVRVRLEDLVPLLQAGENALVVSGLVNGQPFEGTGVIQVQSPQVGLWFTPRTLNLRSHGQEVMADLRVPDCMDARDIEVASLRLNETVEVRCVVVRKHDRLKVKLDRSEVAAILEPGCDVEIRVGGTIMGVPFVATDHIRVIE